MAQCKVWWESMEKVTQLISHGEITGLSTNAIVSKIMEHGLTFTKLWNHRPFNY